METENEKEEKKGKNLVVGNRKVKSEEIKKGRKDKRERKTKKVKKKNDKEKCENLDK